MKQGNYTDAQIAAHLAEHGRKAYHPKTINSRYRRILTAIEQHEDVRLDMGLVQWSEDDVSPGPRNRS